MRLRLEISLGIGALLGLQVLTTLIATRQLMRAAPAVEHVLREHVSTIDAAEDLLEALSSTTSTPGGARPAEVDAALAVARRHGKAEAESALIDVMEARIDAALSGDPGARREVIRAIRRLSDLNEDAMREAEEESRALSITGAWATVVLGIASFWASVAVSRRLRARLEAPMVELDHVLGAVRRGEHHRRVPIVNGPAEAKRVADNLNWLLDRDEAGPAAAPSDATLQRAIALHVLDHDPVPTVVVDGDGELLATNRAAMARLDPGGGGLPGALRRVPPADLARAIDGWVPQRIGELDLWVWRRSEPVEG